MINSAAGYGVFWKRGILSNHAVVPFWFGNTAAVMAVCSKGIFSVVNFRFAFVRIVPLFIIAASICGRFCHLDKKGFREIV